MRILLRRTMAALASLTLVAASAPGGAAWAGSFQRGSATAAEAVVPRLGAEDSSGAGRLLAAFAYADTTEYEFPDEEEKKRNVVKDVIIWTTVAGFVAFFFIEVFLEGDTAAEDPPPTRKRPPPLPTVSGR